MANIVTINLYVSGLRGAVVEKLAINSVWRDPEFDFEPGSYLKKEAANGWSAVDVEADDRAQAMEIVKQAVIAVDPGFEIVQGGDIFMKPA